MCEKKIATRGEIRALGRRELDVRMRGLLRDERHDEVEFLRHLDAFGANRGWEAFGLTSLWDYCTLELGLREGATYRRIHAMFVMRRFPEVEPMLRDGRLCMTTLGLLESHLTEENAAGLLHDAAGKATRYVEEEIVAKLKGSIVSREQIRQLGVKLAPISATAAEARRGEVEAAGGTVEAASTEVAPAIEQAVEERLAAMTTVLVTERGKNTIRGVSADQFQVDATVDREWMRLYRALEARLGIKGVAAVTFHCMQETEKRLGKKDGVSAATGEPVPQPEKKSYKLANGDAAYIPADLERAVRVRDGNRCQWKKPAGPKCLAPGAPQLDHKLARALGGKTELPNLQVLCAAHNQEKARRDFGADFIEQKIKTRREEAKRKKDAGSLPAPEAGEAMARDGPSPGS